MTTQSSGRPDGATSGHFQRAAKWPCTSPTRNGGRSVFGRGGGMVPVSGMRGRCDEERRPDVRSGRRRIVGIFRGRGQDEECIGSAPPGERSWSKMYLTRSELLFKRIFSRMRLRYVLTVLMLKLNWLAISVMVLPSPM